MHWYYAKDGQSAGPLSDVDFQKRVRAGEVQEDTLVWHEGLQNWTAFGELPADSMGHVRPRLKLAVREGEDTCSQCGQIFAADLLADREGAKYCAQCAALADHENPVPRTGLIGATPNRDIMAQARASLGGRWGMAIGVVLVWLVIQMAVSSVPIAGAVAMLLIAGPMSLGLAAFFLTAGRNEEAQFGILFAGFRHFGAAFMTCLLLGVLVFLWLLPSFVMMGIGMTTGIVTALRSGHGRFDLAPESSLAMFGLGVLVACLTSVYVKLRYSMTYFVLAENTEAGALAAVTASKTMMKGHYWKLFCLNLRFLGWALLCIPTFGIGFLWLVPYMVTSHARFYDDIRG